MSDTAINPCMHKKVCKTCAITYLKDRPGMCLQIACEDYTPCKKCQANRILGDDGRCSSCTRLKEGSITLTDAEGQTVEIPEQAVRNFRLNDEQKPALPPPSIPTVQLQEALVKVRATTISLPGKPPPEYTDSEKEYYLATWQEYEGHYRDPTVRAVLHNIIVIEIELQFLVSYIAQCRGQDVSQLEKQRGSLIRNLEQLRNQLPEKEALDMSDDEKSLAMIYERYCEVNKLRSVGKVSRVISQEAIALAPALTFPVDPQEMLTRLGYRTVDAIQACDAITVADLPSNPKQLLEFFGFFLDEKFALPIDTQAILQEEADVELPDVEEAMAAGEEAIATMQEEARNKAMPRPLAGRLPVVSQDDSQDFIIMTDDDE